MNVKWVWGKFEGSTIETELERAWLVLLKVSQNEQLGNIIGICSKFKKNEVSPVLIQMIWALKQIFFHPNWSSLGTMCWPWSLLGHVHLSLCQKLKLRVATAENNPVVAMTQPWVLRTLTQGKVMSWGWLLSGILRKVGLNEWREIKNKIEVTKKSHLHIRLRKGKKQDKKIEKLGEIKW